MSFVFRIVPKFGPLLRQRTLQVVSRRPFAPSWGPPPPVIEKKDVELRVMSVLAKHDKIDAKSLTAKSELARDLGLDSLDLIECVVELEDEFKLEVNDGDVESLTSVSRIVDFVIKELVSRNDVNKRPDIEFGENMTQNRPLD